MNTPETNSDLGHATFTTWTIGRGRLELTDVLAWPEDDRPEASAVKPR